MKTNDHVTALVDEEIPERPRIAKTRTAPPKRTTTLHTNVKTLDEWNAWMRARGRYQWESEE